MNKKCIVCNNIFSKKQKEGTTFFLFKRKFCSKFCQGKWFSGNKNPEFIHGLRKTRFYHIFNTMSQRCNNPKSSGYYKYGARGIKCEWENFIEFQKDMYKFYLEHIQKFGEKQTQIDRINNAGNYCRKNCHWVTLKEQARNRKDNKMITFNGKTKCMTEWAEIFNLNVVRISRRLHDGWSIEESLTIPIKKYERRF